MVRYVAIDEVYKIHRLILERAGTTGIVRDFSLLHSAVERPRATYLGRSLYPTIFAKAAALLHSICLNHPFTDGNKRTAWAATLRFLWINGYHLKAERKEAVRFMLMVDNEKLELSVISSWLKSHSRRLD
jgi:death-on-curing protein